MAGYCVLCTEDQGCRPARELAAPHDVRCILARPVVPEVGIGERSERIGVPEAPCRELRLGASRLLALLAASHLVVNLEILQWAAIPAPPAVSLLHPLDQAAIELLPQFDPLHLLQYLLAGSGSVFSALVVRRA